MLQVRQSKRSFLHRALSASQVRVRRHELCGVKSTCFLEYFMRLRASDLLTGRSKPCLTRRCIITLSRYKLVHCYLVQLDVPGLGSYVAVVL